MGSPLQALGDFAARAAGGALFGQNVGRSLFGAGQAVAGAAIGAASPIIGGILGLVGALGSGDDPPPDPLRPLKEAEAAIGRGDFETANERVRQFDELRLGSLRGATSRQGVAGVRGVASGGTTFARDRFAGEEVLLANQIQAVAGNFTGRELLSQIDFGPGPVGTASLLPIGAITDPTTKARFLETTPLDLRQGAFSQSELDRLNTALLARRLDNPGVRGVAINPNPTVIVDPSIAPDRDPVDVIPSGQFATSGPGVRGVSPRPLDPTRSQQRAARFVSERNAETAARIGRTPASPGQFADPRISLREFGALARDRELRRLGGASPEAPPLPQAPNPRPTTANSPNPAPPSNQVGVRQMGFNDSGPGAPTGIGGVLAGLGQGIGSVISGVTGLVQSPLGQSFIPIAQQAALSRLGGAPVASITGTNVATFSDTTGVRRAMAGTEPGEVDRLINRLQGEPQMIGAPFRLTSSGQARAETFALTLPNGRTEWFMPAGKPKTFTKARRIVRRCRPR